MSAPAAAKEKLQVVEANTLVLHTAFINGETLWTWQLQSEKGEVVARETVSRDIERLVVLLCSVFDLKATPEHYLSRIRNRTLREVESASRKRWFDVRFEEV